MTARPASYRLTNCQVATLCPDDAPWGLIPDGTIVVAGELLAWVGSENDLPAEFSSLPTVDLDRRLVTPGLIDCHTHLIYGGNRADEFEQRLAGASYTDIARAGGGILSTVRATREASDQQLLETATRRAMAAMRQGVTTLEVKTGYGLDRETELRLLRVAGQLAEQVPIDICITLLAAHALPPEFAGRADEYVDHICLELLPAAVGLCESVDVFCESIAFSLEQSRRVLEAAGQLGFSLKIHAEQLSNQGGAAMAASLGALSADHLEYLDEPGVRAMAAHGTVATLLPAAFYFLRETQKPPLDLLRRHGVTIAVASDANPGSAPVESRQVVLNMACTLFGMTVREAVFGMTGGAAAALGKAETIGRLQAGFQADLAVWDVTTPAELAYWIGKNTCVAVWKSGERIHETSL